MTDDRKLPRVDLDILVQFARQLRESHRYSSSEVLSALEQRLHALALAADGSTKEVRLR